jgi:hypothetical protein
MPRVGFEPAIIMLEHPNIAMPYRADSRNSLSWIRILQGTEFLWLMVAVFKKCG